MPAFSPLAATTLPPGLVILVAATPDSKPWQIPEDVTWQWSKIDTTDLYSGNGGKLYSSIPSSRWVRKQKCNTSEQIEAPKVKPPTAVVYTGMPTRVPFMDALEEGLLPERVPIGNELGGGGGEKSTSRMTPRLLGPMCKGMASSSRATGQRKPGACQKRF